MLEPKQRHLDEISASEPPADQTLAPRENPVVRTLRQRPELVLSPALLIVAMLLWEIIVRRSPNLEFIVSRPSLIGEALVQAVTSSQLWIDIGTTVSQALVGFSVGFIAALTIGLGVVMVPRVEELLVPYLIASYAVPVLVTAPLFVMWFGYGFQSKAIIAGFTAFFPMLVSILNGFRTPDAPQVEMLTSFTASRSQVFRMSRLPNAVPYIFTAIEVGIVFSMLGSIVGEFAGASQGLGFRVLSASYGFAIADMFVTLMVLAAIGFIAHTLVATAQRKIAFWNQPESVTI